MTATVTRPQVRRTAENAGDPIVDAWVNPFDTDGPPGLVVGYYQRLEDGQKERIANPVFQGETSRLYFAPALVCTEEGAWF